MRNLLQTAGGWKPDSLSTGPHKAPQLLTITPWSLVESSHVVQGDVSLRRKLFGECKIGLLYSGNLGRAHDFQLLLELARRFRGQSIHFCFAGRGPGMDWVQSQLNSQDSNISTAGFADESELQARLSACDIHLVSLKDNWTGTVVPSKFFGALSIGRPVLFAGADDSCISQWINEYQIGWNVNYQNLDSVFQAVLDYSDHTKEHVLTNQRCWQVYQQQFSKSAQVKKWLEVVQNNAVERPSHVRV
jgi:glycosyltransferase involved in cell wall biosynthesis